MRYPSQAKIAAAGFAALGLGGCLVSEEPVLDAASGSARPLPPGDYVSCPLDPEKDDDCQALSVADGGGGLYKMTADDEDPVGMRFRRVGRNAYAVQSDEGGDDYVYYYGAGDAKRFLLTMMMCSDLPASLRDGLIAAGDLETEDDDYSTCTVKTLKGLTASAKAYYRGKVESEDKLVLELKPAPKGSSASE